MIARLTLAAALLAATLPAAAQTMKPGLWEIRNRMTNNPQMDQAMAEMQKQLAAMPPEQRKQMEAMMAQQGVRMMPGAQGMTVQVCMTKEQVERNEMPMSQGDCKITSQSRSGGTVKMAFACANPPTTGEGQFTMTGAEAYSSQMTVKSTLQGKTETTSMEGSGKWLGADCGGVKPMQMPRK